MMTMTVIPMNIRSREVRADLADSQRLHMRIMHMFQDTQRESNRVLYRVEGVDVPIVIVQAESRPNTTVLPNDYVRAAVRVRDDLEDAFGHIHNGQKLHFRLRANVTKKLATQQQSKGKRIAITDSQEQVEWLLRKGQQSGFVVLPDPFAIDGYAITVIDEGKFHGVKRKHVTSNKLTHAGVRYEGTLEVTDVQLFVDALRSGIGPAKAYGFGLMSVALV
jgi:CRISPR system Cascade subunit CasE